MKRYLFGLGAMLVGAGLMFIFTHTEVSAESEANKPESYCEEITPKGSRYTYNYCKIKDVTCVTRQVTRKIRELSCVR